MVKDGNTTPCETPQLTDPSTAATPSIAEILTRSTSLAPIPRFWYLLPHAKTLIRLHGPYTTHADTTVLSRAFTPRSTKTTKPPSAQLLAVSFTAAQDAYGSAQSDGPVQDDLELFAALWETTVQVVEQILEEGIPDGEAFGWGIYSITLGSMPLFPAFASSTRPGETTNFDDEFFSGSEHELATLKSTGTCRPENAFEALRRRLHAALSSLPSVNVSRGERGEKNRAPVSPADRIGRLVKTRNEVHLCGTLLVQVLRENEWRSVRWWHLVAVVERWLGNLELAKEWA
jgi:hypothetical protein